MADEPPFLLASVGRNGLPFFYKYTRLHLLQDYANYHCSGSS